MENIPYYNFSTFPVGNDILLKRINRAAVNGYKMIFINFGEYFPWSSESMVSNFAFSDKLIDKIVTICLQNEIALVPVLSVLSDSDFITNDGRYKSFVNDVLQYNGLQLLSCGVGKLAEDLIDDLYSLLLYSDYLLVEIPPSEFNEGKLSKQIITFILRLSENLNDINKKLILNCDSNTGDCLKFKKSDNINVFSKISETKSNLYNGKYNSIDLYTDTIELEKKEYRLFRIKSSESLSGGLDVGNIVSNYKNLGFEINNYNIKLDKIEAFFENLYFAWDLIRECGEKLSLFYRNNDMIYRIKFSRSVLILNQAYTNLKLKSNVMLDILEKEYQPDKFRQWINSKTDSVYKQLNDFDIIARYIKEGYVE